VRIRSVSAELRMAVIGVFSFRASARNELRARLNRDKSRWQSRQRVALDNTIKYKTPDRCDVAMPVRAPVISGCCGGARISRALRRRWPSSILPDSRRLGQPL